jgi:hypothetical protein
LGLVSTLYFFFYPAIACVDKSAHVSAGVLRFFYPVFACAIAFVSTTHVILSHNNNVPSTAGT